MKRRVRENMRRRKMWRLRATHAARELLRLSTLGMADSVRSELGKSIDKVRQWNGRRGELVVMAIQRKALFP